MAETVDAVVTIEGETWLEWQVRIFENGSPTRAADDRREMWSNRVPQHTPFRDHRRRSSARWPAFDIDSLQSEHHNSGQRHMPLRCPRVLVLAGVLRCDG